MIKRLKGGDQQAFDKIYYLYCDKLYAFSIGLLKDPHSAQETVQEVFVKLWEKRDQINLEMNFDNYLITITHNCIKKKFRKRKIERKAKDNLMKAERENVSSHENIFIYNDLFLKASKFIEKLPPRRKQVYIMRRQEGLKIKEIAAILNISKRTVECHLSKALKSLKTELENSILS